MMSEDIKDPVEGETYRRLIVVAAVAFMVLPFITTFNEFITKVVESLQLVALVQSLVAPFMVRVVAVSLRAVGVPAAGSGSYLYLSGWWMSLKIYISWNCIGWQSFILLAFTFVTGLQGSYTRRSKILTVLLGVEGTFIVNVLRILIPCLLAYNVGYVPAIVFHDYMGTVMTILWLGIFWYLSFGCLLIGGGPSSGGIPSSSLKGSTGNRGGSQKQPTKDVFDEGVMMVG